MDLFKKIIVLGYLFLVCLSMPSRAQQYYFRTYETGDGLAQNWVRAIVQDSVGRLWIGTADGISIYDGINFTNFTSLTGLKNTTINDFNVLDARTVAAASNGGGIMLFSRIPFQGDSLAQYLSGPSFFDDDSINVIFKDKNKDFWFSTDVGLTQWHHDLQGQWSIRKYDKSNGIKGTYITTIAQTPDSILWFGTANGLYSFKNSIFKHYNQKSGFPELPVTTLFTDSRNRLWVGTTRGVFIYENDRFAPFSPGGHFFSYNITATVESRDGDMWIGTPRGLFQYDGDRIVNYTRNSGLSNDYISSLLQDREGNIWIGTHNGLNVLPNLKFSFIKIRTNLEHLNKLTPDSAGKIWVTSDSGLYTLENYHLKPYKLPSSPAVKSIRKIYFDGPDTLLLGTTHGLVMIKNHKTTEFTRADGLASNFISDIVRDEDGTYWIGTQGGLAAIRQGKIYDLTSHISEGYPRRLDLVRKSKVSDKLIHDLAIDRKNNLWIGTWAHGLFEVTEDSVIPFGTTQGLTDRNIRSLYIDHESDLWIATRYGGVFRYNGEDIHQFTKENGLSGNWVFTILEDREGNHWFGTANGLSMYDGRSWKNFGTRDGVTSGGITSSAIDKKGRLWFGSDDALSCYVQKKSSLHTVPPKVYIKSIRFTDDVSPKIFRSVKLPVPFGTQKPAAGISKLSGNPLLNFNYDHRSIKIEFAGIGLKDEAAVKYQYKLEGLDDDWSAITSQNIVTYIKLPPGTYTFRVRAKNRDGIWSLTPANASFVIETPLWQQVWFIILMAVIAVSAIVLVVMMIYQARLTQLLHVKHMRDTIATDLHDDIGSSLSSISIFSELARRQLKKSPVHAANLMQRIERISRNLIDAMDDIVWSINADNDSLEDAILRIQEFAVSILEAKGISVTFTLPDYSEHVILPLETRRNLLLIFKEMIHNTSKHSEADTVNIYIALNSTITIRVEDNGKGFTPETVRKGNGLLNIQKRASAINGTFTIRSAPSQGTVCTLKVPTSP